MHFLPALLLCLITTTTGLSPATTTVYNDITNLDNQVLTLINELNSYQGGLVATTPLVAQLTIVHLATRKGYYDSILLPDPLSDDDAEALVDHVGNTLSIDNPDAVAILKTKKPLFDAVGASPGILAGLEVLLNDHLAFSDEVLGKLPPAELSMGNEVVNIITEALESGIAYYSS